MYETILQDVAAALDGVMDKTIRIGIGLQDSESILVRMLADLRRDIRMSSLTIVIYTSLDGFELSASAGTILKWSNEPESAMISDFQAGRLDAIIRGQLSSAIFLEQLKNQFSIKNVCRLALLTTNSGQDFFLAPVGIDEARNVEEKELLIDLASKLMDRLGIVPSFYVLSAGRLDDAGRDEIIARSLRDAMQVVEETQATHEGLAIQHGEILIEDAFVNGANVIIAPDGVSGNLIYRTLLHLGGGHSHGAYYLNGELPGPVMDTSRAGTAEEYAGAVVLALRLLEST
ncbi:MAG TPA: methanogenesis marker protein Mmp4/MtxX [Candidatus Lokiarchaeia archaeon]|nr:methanogenesis marker protein Mmp4/MtxX [Candidatus Lokiarchaeia archaeon]